MARSRNIKPGFFTNDKLAELPALTRLLFIGLWTLVDRAGRVEDRPKKIQAEALPYDEGDADSMLTALQVAGFIERYQVGELRCIQVVNWAKHQNPHIKEVASSLPVSPEHQSSTVLASDMRKTSLVQEQGDAQPEPERAVLIPDSLSLDSGFRIPDSLQKKDHLASQGLAPDVNISKRMTAKELLWALGPAILGTKARTLLGKLVAEFGDDIVARALVDARDQMPIQEPKAWMVAACRAAAKRGTPDKTAGNSTPKWALNAGFANRFEAENDGCFEHNAGLFRNAKRERVPA